MYSTILFDLDGTLTDPAEGITNSVAHALRRLGIEPPERSELLKFIGPPLKDSFMKYYCLSEEEAVLAIEYYREHFRPVGIFENEVYEGVREMLESLKASGKRIILATSKPEEFACRILVHFDLDKYFDLAAGATMDSTRVAKADVIKYALESAKITDLENCVMVGDRSHDVIGAMKLGIDSIGVLYGYGDRDELESAGVTYIAETVADILKFI